MSALRRPGSGVSGGAWVVAALLLFGCDASAIVVVDVKTDYIGGVEFTAVRTERVRVFGGSEAPLAQIERPAFRTDAWLDGARVAMLEEVPPGLVNLEVSLLDSNRDVVATRPVRVMIDGPSAVTILITRDCGGLMCPGAGDDPSAIACYGDRCVPPECTVENALACGPAACTDSSECPAGAACTSGACTDGVCFIDADDALCSAGDFCHPMTGCSTAPPEDAGVPDGGLDDAGRFDAGPPIDAGPDAAPPMDAGFDASLPPTCSMDSECGSVTFGAWGACTGAADPCGETGSQSRTVFTPRCVSSMCTVVMSPDSQSCMQRSTAGVVCRPPMRHPWQPCMGFSGFCDDTGTQIRDVDRYRCVSEACIVNATIQEMQSCSRTPSNDGQVCATGGTYCGTTMACRRCAGGSCAVDMPNYDGACNPSCGTTNMLCSGVARDCPGGSCPGGTMGPGPWADTSLCCSNVCVP